MQPRPRLILLGAILSIVAVLVLAVATQPLGDRAGGADPLSATPPPVGRSPAASAFASPADPDSPSSAASPSTPASPVSTATPTPAPAVLVGAGDIAVCGTDDDEATARLLDAIGGTVFSAGDGAYDDGRKRDFERCYDPTWGRHLDRTLPAPGNHDYGTKGAAGYLAYFGEAARPDGTTWYATDLGAWRVIVLDSNCDDVRGGCGPDSPQVRWLREELATDPRQCTLAIWHHPLFSSGQHGGARAVTEFWTALEEARAEVVVNAHDHDYERFAPQDRSGNADPAGIRQFVAGTGGAALRRFKAVQPNSEVRESGTHGVLELTLRADGYDWRFVPVAGKTFRDEGSGTCR